MSFNDRFADRQAHPHPIGLGREEGIENVFPVRSVETDTRIRHTDDDVASIVKL
jgi:hypothetical protein